MTICCLHNDTHQLLVGNPDLDRLIRRAVLEVEVLDHWHILSSSGVTTSPVVRVWSPVQGDSVGSVVAAQLLVLQERLHLIRELKVLILVVAESKHFVLVRDQRRVCLLHDSLGDRVDQRVEVECWEIGVVRLDVDVLHFVVFANVNRSG